MLGVTFTSASHKYYPTDNWAKYSVSTRSSEAVRFCVLIDRGSDVSLVFDFGDGHQKLVQTEVDLDFMKVRWL